MDNQWWFSSEMLTCIWCKFSLLPSLDCHPLTFYKLTGQEGIRFLSQSSTVGSEEFRELGVWGTHHSCTGLPLYTCHQGHERGGGGGGRRSHQCRYTFPPSVLLLVLVFYLLPLDSARLPDSNGALDRLAVLLTLAVFQTLLVSQFLFVFQTVLVFWTLLVLDSSRLSRLWYSLQKSPYFQRRICTLVKLYMNKHSEFQPELECSCTLGLVHSCKFL